MQAYINNLARRDLAADCCFGRPTGSTRTWTREAQKYFRKVKK